MTPGIPSDAGRVEPIYGWAAVAPGGRDRHRQHQSNACRGARLHQLDAAAEQSDRLARDPRPDQPGNGGREVKYQTDIKCACVGDYGPNPDCGGCGGDGCIGGTVYDSDAERDRTEQLEKFRRHFAKDPHHG